jgi:hypothetical protein
MYYYSIIKLNREGWQGVVCHKTGVYSARLLVLSGDYTQHACPPILIALWVIDSVHSCDPREWTGQYTGMLRTRAQILMVAYFFLDFQDLPALCVKW